MPDRFKPTAIDLFSGCGGLTLGMRRAGYRVISAIECEPLAAATYRKNNPRTELYEADIRALKPSQLLSDLKLKPGELTLLAGCPPCQGFSTLRTRNGGLDIEEPMNELVYEFARFVETLLPQAIMMENVPGLATDERIRKTVQRLSAIGYRCKVDVFDASEFGAPQRRRRMILIGIRNAEPDFAKPSARRRTVRSIIGKLPLPGKSGDELHDYPVRRAAHVMEIIQHIPKDGGSRGDLPDYLQLECHKNLDGFKDVYGRMSWNKPSPTITGGCINPSKGRFLHPSEDRAITLREAAMLQGFPRKYHFEMTKGRYMAAQMVGNAFPPIFAEKHALAIRTSLERDKTQEVLNGTPS